MSCLSLSPLHPQLLLAAHHCRMALTHGTSPGITHSHLVMVTSETRSRLLIRESRLAITSARERRGPQDQGLALLWPVLAVSYS